MNTAEDTDHYTKATARIHIPVCTNQNKYELPYQSTKATDTTTSCFIEELPTGRNTRLFKDLKNTNTHNKMQWIYEKKYLKDPYTTTTTDYFSFEREQYSPTMCYDNTDSTSVTYNPYYQYIKRIKYYSDTPAACMRDIIRSRHAPAIHLKQHGLRKAQSDGERRARETLKRIVGIEAYRRYLNRGFLVAHGASGRTYQIFPGHAHTRVWKDGKRIEDLCVILPSTFPQTDSVIARLLMIQQSEEIFKSHCNVWDVRRNTPDYRPRVAREIEEKTLPELFAEIKTKRQTKVA